MRNQKKKEKKEKYFELRAAGMKLLVLAGHKFVVYIRMRLLTFISKNRN